MEPAPGARPPGRLTKLNREGIDLRHLTLEELEAGLDLIRRSPRDNGVLELIVRRPAEGARERLLEGELHPEQGLVGDSWISRMSRHTPDGSPHPGKQLTLMNTRAAALVAVDPERRELAGDQLYLDLDLSGLNLPPGTRLSLGSALLEVSELPHTGCGKFVERFGLEAMKFVNSPLGRELNLRGINARVVQAGTIRVGDVARKVPAGQGSTQGR